MKILVDTSSVVWAGLLSGKDKEFGYDVHGFREDGKPVHVNSHRHGFDSACRFLKERLDQLGAAPKDMIFVVEGQKSKLLRTSISDTYKANRSGSRPPEQYQEFNTCRDRLVQQFRDLGAVSVTQDGLEADDVICYLAKVLPSTVIISTDGDLQQCISDQAHLLYQSEFNKNRYGPFPTRYTTLYKALVGDTSDNIKGAFKFGEKAFLDLYVGFGEEGLDSMIELIQQRRLEELHEDVPAMKALQRVIDGRDGVYLSWDLARMYPEKVNTWRSPLRWGAGLVAAESAETHPDLRGWCAQRKIVHAGNYDASMAHAATHVPSAAYVGLDIETTSTEESDEWLESKKRKAATDSDARDLGVDQFGQTLVSMGVTYGDNDQYTLYFTHAHKETSSHTNLTSEQVRAFVDLIPKTTPIVVQNAAFELTVLEREWGDALRENGWHGFLPNVHDTKILATHVDENDKNGLKHLSLVHLGYQQVSYAEVTQGRKMHELTALEAFDYGADDPRCTVALYNHFRTLLQIEGTWDAYLQVEQDPAYLTALAYNQGTPISLETLVKLEAEDREAYDAGWVVLREYLMANGWAGSVCPQATGAADITAAFIKTAYLIVTGEELVTKVRTPEKLLLMIEAGEGGLKLQALHVVLERALNSGEVANLNTLLQIHFKGEPDFNLDSPPQISRLMYDVMKLPVRLRNKATDKQRDAGQYEGNARTDDLSMQWAMQNDCPPGAVRDALKAVQAMKIANTRRKMFYAPYRVTQHWKDGLIHANVTQNGTGTRRYSSSGPNLQQLPKHPKATGEPARFREVFVPHHSKAVIVSLDFSGQELRLITDYSQDPMMLSCYVGDNLKDMHSLTASGILKKKALANRVAQIWTLAGRAGDATEEFKQTVTEWRAVDYEAFVALESSEWKALYKVLRAAGKKTNFTTEYGAQAPKVAETLLVDEDEAQQYIDAKLQAFPRADEWKREVESKEYEKLGYTTTMLGARRHLAEALRSGSKWEIGKASRQGVNFKIQGSAAEMTKLAMGRMWRSDIFFRYDARFIAPIHDEVVCSVAISDLIPFLTELHALMVAPYASMTVPIVSSISIGKNFGEQVECGESVDEGTIRAALKQIFPNAANDEEMRQAA